MAFLERRELRLLHKYVFAMCARTSSLYLTSSVCTPALFGSSKQRRERERKRVILFFFLFSTKTSLDAKPSKSSCLVHRSPLSQIRSSYKESRKIDVRNVRSKSRHRHRPSVTSTSSNLLFFHIVCSRGHKSWRSGWNILSGRSGLFQRFSIAIAIVYRSYRWW